MQSLTINGAVATFRAQLLDVEGWELIDEYLLSATVKHLSATQIRVIRQAVADTFPEGKDDLTIIITGSAKIGFALHEKVLPDGKKLPRYRPFGSDSDIDVAVVSRSIFECIWSEVAAHSYRQLPWPWESRRLGDYLVCGWLRPDHFPKSPVLRRCNDWWSCFKRLSRHPVFGRRNVRGGLYYSVDALTQYFSKSLDDCRKFEELYR